jgi:hypothetical protein
MAKLGGPLMSMSASGTVGNIITFATWKGRPYVRTRVIPANPKTAAQLGVRAMMTFLSQTWAGLSDANKATWDLAADARKVSPFNAFVAANQGFWRDNLPPGKIQTLLRTTLAALIGSTSAAAQGRYMAIDITNGVAAGQWGNIIYVSPTTGFTPNWNTAQKVAPLASGATGSFLLGPMASGDYYLRYKSFSIDGLFNGAYVDEDTVTIV